MLKKKKRRAETVGKNIHECGTKSLATRVDEEVCVISIFQKFSILLVVINLLVFKHWKAN